MSFKLQMSPKNRAAARFIASVQKAIVTTALAERDQTNITQQQIATRLGVNRSVVNRILKGEANLTLRSVAEIAWALGYSPKFTLHKCPIQENSNRFICEDDDLQIKEVVLTKPGRTRREPHIRAENTKEPEYA